MDQKYTFGAHLQRVMIGAQSVAMTSTEEPILGFTNLIGVAPK
jgi:hypothetical protein